MAVQSNYSDDLDAELRRVLTAVIDPTRVRAWLIERIAEHAIELVKQEEASNATPDPTSPI